MDHSLLDFSNRSYLITGAASGLGRATSLRLSALGAKLILVDINEEGLKQVQKECSSPSTICALNLTEISLLKQKITETVADFGRINGMVHLAGRPYVSPLKSINDKTTHDVFLLNTLAGLELSKIITNKNIYAGEHGAIIFISSVYGVVGSAANVVYAMSKSALHGITKSLAIELAPKKIRVNCIAPGFIKTKMLAEVSTLFTSDYDEKLAQLHPLGLGEPDDVAHAVSFLLSDMAKWITGTIMNVDGGFTAQ